MSDQSDADQPNKIYEPVFIENTATISTPNGIHVAESASGSMVISSDEINPVPATVLEPNLTPDDEDLETNTLIEVQKRILGATTEEVVELAASRVRHAKDIHALVQRASAAETALLYFAEHLGVKYPVAKANVETGEYVHYYMDVVASASGYTPIEIALIGTHTKKSLERLVKASKLAINATETLKTRIAELESIAKERALQVQKLSTPVKHPTIEDHPYVLAYLDQHGKFVYLGMRQHKTTEKKYLGRVHDFAAATKFPSADAALSKLRSLLTDFNHAVPTASRLHIYSANLLLQLAVPGIETLSRLREGAEKYETLMQAERHEKKQRKKQARKAKRRQLEAKTKDTTKRTGITPSGKKRKKAANRS